MFEKNHITDYMYWLLIKKEDRTSDLKGKINLYDELFANCVPSCDNDFCGFADQHYRSFFPLIEYLSLRQHKIQVPWSRESHLISHELGIWLITLRHMRDGA